MQHSGGREVAVPFFEAGGDRGDRSVPGTEINDRAWPKSLNRRAATQVTQLVSSHVYCSPLSFSSNLNGVAGSTARIVLGVGHAWPIDRPDALLEAASSAPWSSDAASLRMSQYCSGDRRSQRSRRLSSSVATSSSSGSIRAARAAILPIIPRTASTSPSSSIGRSSFPGIT